MIPISRRYAAPALAAALLTLHAAGAAAQGQVVRLPERDRALAGSAPQVFAVGRADGSEHESFGEVSSVAFDAAENLYVLDRPSARVLVFDRAGHFVRQIARKGEGPGELMVPLQLAIAGDGTVIVSDLGRPGYSLFRPDGTFLRNLVAGDWMPSFSSTLGWHPRGGVVSAVRRSPGDSGGPGDAQNVLPVVFQPIGGGAAVRLYDIPQTLNIQRTSDAPGQVQVRISPPPAFTPDVLLGVIPNGEVAVSFTPGYTVRILDAGGQTVRYLQRPMRPRLTTERDREAARERRRQVLQSGRGQIRIVQGGGGGGRAPRDPRSNPQMVERMLAEMQFADTIPALNGMRVAPSGKLWLERTAQTIGEDGPIDLVTPQGEYLGTITGVGLPDAISRGGLAAFIEQDDDGVDHVVVRRLPAAWR
jgi:6-bladed beta-propeller